MHKSTSIASLKFILVVLCLLIGNLIGSHWTLEDEDDLHFHEGRDADHDQATARQSGQPMPKDKILLSDIKTLIFQRNKRTTSRRTHTIPQLSCVGGTAGCKLFTTDLVECENAAAPGERAQHISKINWKCHADIDKRVRFNHVEVICEGYDYPEDDYILLGSCGLEFTLDYVDPHDYHDNSYFKHMDEHEKELHHDRTRKKLAEDKQRGASLFASLAMLAKENSYLVGAFLLLVVALLFILVKYFLSSSRAIGGAASRNQSPNKQASARKQPVRGYGPLTSAVLTTKKAC